VALFNWIEARFAQGTDTISDAPEELAREIAASLAERPVRRIGCEFGSLPLAGRHTGIYLRFSQGGPSFVHAVVWDAGGGAMEPERVAGVFARRYGDAIESRVRELVRRLATLSVAQATLPLSELFVEADALGPTRAQSASPAPRRRRPREASRAPVLPWLLVAGSAALAGFFAGRPALELQLPHGGAAPALERRVARLESDRNAVDTSLRIQLQHERRLREQLLADRQRETRDLLQRLEQAEAALAGVRDHGDGDAALTLAEVPARAPESSEPDGEGEAAIAALPPVSAGVPAAPRPPAPGPPPPLAHTAMVTADLLWVRIEPGVAHAKVSALTWGTLVELDGDASESGEWIRISEPTAGWVASRYLEPMDADETEAREAVPDA
jgi:hypothetical protein